MLQNEYPEDFVVSTGRSESVRKFIEISASKLKWNKSPNGNPIVWEGQDLMKLVGEQIQMK